MFAALVIVLSGCASAPVVEVDGGWEKLPDLPRVAIGSAASANDNLFVVTGGARIDFTAGSDVQVLDLDRLEWSVAGQLIEGRLMHGQVTLEDGRVLIVGGRRFAEGNKYQALDSCELLERDGSSSSTTGALPEPMGTPRVHLLVDGRVAAAGGGVVCVYDPQRGEWEAVARLHETRVEHTTVMLDDGTLLVIGGLHRDSVERVDLDAGVSMLLTARLPQTTDDLAAVQLNDGRVWVLGGQDSNSGRTLDRTWLLTLTATEQADIERGPNLPNLQGIADQQVIATPHGHVLIGGESQTEFGDFELNHALLIDPAHPKPAFARLPNTTDPHDDAVSGWADGWLIVAGGQTTGGGINVLRLPLPVMRVERLRLSGPHEAGTRPRD